MLPVVTMRQGCYRENRVLYRELVSGIPLVAALKDRGTQENRQMFKDSFL